MYKHTLYTVWQHSNITHSNINMIFAPFPPKKCMARQQQNGDKYKCMS